MRAHFKCLREGSSYCKAPCVYVQKESVPKTGKLASNWLKTVRLKNIKKDVSRQYKAVFSAHLRNRLDFYCYLGLITQNKDIRVSEI